MESNMKNLNFLKKKSNILNRNLNEETQDNDSNFNTSDYSEKINFGWVTKVKILPVGTIAFLTLLTAIGFYVNYTTNLDKNRQEVAHLADLRQLSERVEKNGILIKNADENSFNELNNSKDRIEKILQVLQNGGKINSQNTIIDPIDSIYNEKFIKVKNDWTTNKNFIESILKNKNALISLKKSSDEALNNNKKLIADINSLIKLTKRSSLENISKELYILNIKIDKNISNLFTGDNFSINTGYELVKDLREFDILSNGILKGNNELSIEKTNNEEILKLVNNIQKNFIPYNNTITLLIPQIENLNATKNIAKLISKNAHAISLTAEELNNSFILQVDNLNNQRSLSIFLFLISLSSFGLLALVFYEKSLQALRFAKILEKNQANESAVNLLISQMSPLDEGDFTKQVHVEDKFVLPIAEKIDNTREIFGNIVRKIKASVESVQYSANATDKHSQELLKVASEQYNKMESTIFELSRITSEMDEIAQTTWIARDESNQSKQASQNGGKLVQESINKMIEIRNKIQESSKKIKKSSESAQAITEVTGLIQGITKQIEVLALNAAIQAAASGESEREFTVVAQEVQRLALDSKEATNKILTLVKAVQEDIGIAVFSMEITTQEVVEGTKLNDSAGKALRSIEDLSQKVADRVIEASQKLEEKSTEMTSISLSMKELQVVTEHNTEIVKSTVEEVEALNQVSRELEGSIHGFKVN